MSDVKQYIGPGVKQYRNKRCGHVTSFIGKPGRFDDCKHSGCSYSRNLNEWEEVMSDGASQAYRDQHPINDKIVFYRNVNCEHVMGFESTPHPNTICEKFLNQSGKVCGQVGPWNPTAYGKSPDVPAVFSFEEYQANVRETAVYPNVGNNLAYPALGLAGEAGEVCNVVKKVYRDDDGVPSPEKRAKIADELGYTLWYLAKTADEIGIDLATIARRNNERLLARKNKGTLKGSGDNR